MIDRATQYVTCTGVIYSSDDTVQDTTIFLSKHIYVLIETLVISGICKRSVSLSVEYSNCT